MLIGLSGSRRLMWEKINGASDGNENCAFEKGEGHSLVWRFSKRHGNFCPSVTAGFRITPIQLMRNAWTQTLVLVLLKRWFPELELAFQYKSPCVCCLLALSTLAWIVLLEMYSFFYSFLVGSDSITKPFAWFRNLNKWDCYEWAFQFSRRPLSVDFQFSLADPARELVSTWSMSGTVAQP